MSWELVSLLSMIVLCGTILTIARELAPRRIDREVSRQIGILLDDMRILSTRVKVIEDNQVAILKVAEEAKKLVSQQNVAQSLGGIRIGGSR